MQELYEYGTPLPKLHWCSQRTCLMVTIVSWQKEVSSQQLSFLVLVSVLYLLSMDFPWSNQSQSNYFTMLFWSRSALPRETLCNNIQHNVVSTKAMLSLHSASC